MCRYCVLWVLDKSILAILLLALYHYDDDRAYKAIDIIEAAINWMVGAYILLMTAIVMQAQYV